MPTGNKLINIITQKGLTMKYSEERKAKMKQYYLDNKTEMSDIRKEYYRINKEAIKKRVKKYRENHKDIEAARHKKYYVDNYEMIIEKRNNNKIIIAEKAKEYNKNNREKHNNTEQKRQAKKKALPHTLTVKQWETIKLKFNNKCAYCGEDKSLAKDHFLALTKGGEYSHNNIIPTCQNCNSSKGNKDFFEWFPKYKYYSKKREIKILEFLGYDNEIQQFKII